MKKILFIITKSEMGGAQRFLYELVTHLSPNKYDIVVTAGGQGELFKKLGEKNIKTIKIRNFSNVPGIKNLLAFFEILGLIIKTKPDIIYLLSSEAGFSGSIAGSLYRLITRRTIKIIYRIGGWAFKEPKIAPIKKIYLWAEKISASFKDIIITNSEFDRHLAMKNKIANSEKITTIYNGINLPELKFLPKEESLNFLKEKIFHNSKLIIYNSIIIGTIANLYKNKGIEYLILAIARMRDHHKLNFVIIGDGPEKEKLEKLIKKQNLENKILLIGFIPDAYQYLKAFDLFVLPSVKEGQPWVILETMAAGVPIVATNIAGISEMIENEKLGLLVEPADPRALSLAIEKILTRPSLAQECAARAFEIVKEKFGIDEMIQKNEELF